MFGALTDGDLETQRFRGSKVRKSDVSKATRLRFGWILKGIEALRH